MPLERILKGVALTHVSGLVRTGKKKKDGNDVIDIVERVRALGVPKSKGLIGLHNLGADWGGKCVGISKETWIKSYLF